MFFVSLANNQSQEDVETMSNVTQSIFHSKFIYFLDNKFPFCQKKWPNHSQKNPKQTPKIRDEHFVQVHEKWRLNFTM